MRKSHEFYGKGIYKISDNCYSFWYKFVFPNIGAIESENG